MATILIPTPLRKFTDNSAKVVVEGYLLSTVLANLVTAYPDLQNHLLDSSGSIRPFINVFVGPDDIRSLSAQNTTIELNSIISIVPAIAGGNLNGRRL
jgi:molybdopterin converting factor small subunit